MLAHGSCAGCTVVDVESLCHVASAPRLNVPLLSIRKMGKIKKMCDRFCWYLMGTHYLSLIQCLSSGVVRLVNLYFAEHLDYRALDRDFQLYLCRYARGVFFGWQSVELFALSPSHHMSHYIKTPVGDESWRGLYTSRSSASSFFISLHLNFKTTFSSGFA